MLEQLRGASMQGVVVDVFVAVDQFLDGAVFVDPTGKLPLAGGMDGPSEHQMLGVVYLLRGKTYIRKDFVKAVGFHLP